MSKQPASRRPQQHADHPLEALHLRRELKTALELAMVALAPTELMERLATLAGLLDALSQLPTDSAPALALLPGTVERARAALADWTTWQKLHLHASA